jgi:hypothetical protein
VTPALLRQLMGLVDARKARDLALLDGLLAEDRRLAAEVEELSATAARDQAASAPLPPLQQGLRLAWADQRIRAIRRRRNELAAGIRAARAAAAQSLGKHSSLEHLVDRADRTDRQLRAARTEREAPPPALRRE